MGKSLFWYSSEVLFAYFLTELAGLASPQMGLVLAIGFLVNAGIDLTFGQAMARSLAAVRQAARLQFIGAVLCSVALIAVFACAWLPTDLRFAGAIVAGIAFRLTYAAYDIPQNALMALATADSDSRLRVASTRIWFSGAATLVIAALVAPLVSVSSRHAGILFLLIFTAIASVIAVGTAAALTVSLRGTPVHQIPDRQGVASKPSTVVIWSLYFVMIVTSVFTPLFAKLEPYFTAYTLRAPLWGGVVIILMAVGIIAGQPAWLWLRRRLSNGALMALCAIVQIVALAVFWAAGSDRLALSAGAFGFGLGNGGVGFALWAGFSEVGAHTGPRRAVVSYGIFSAAAHLGFAMGSLLLGVLLARSDFRGAGSGYLTGLMTATPGIGAALCIAAAISLGIGVNSQKGEC